MADPKQKPHYINNKEFSLAVVEYVTNKNKLEEEGICVVEHQIQNWDNVFWDPSIHLTL